MNLTASPFLRACAPALLLPFAIFLLGWFWGRPQLSPDTATGLLAWHDFTAGGQWNAVSEPARSDLGADIAQPVTWWSPGQYVAPGLLISAGFSAGASFLLVALFSACSFTIGLARFARALGAADEAIPWVALGAAGGWHTLYGFGFFVGGEVVLAAVWPWIFFAAWQLRERPWKFVLRIPPLLLLGSFAKHSFAIYALGLMVFLSLEATRGKWRSPLGLAHAAWPFVASALLYVAGRILLFDSGPSPSSPGQTTQTLASSFGFSAWAPLLSATGGGSMVGRVFAIAGLDPDQGWSECGLVLAILSPLALAGYLFLARDSRPLSRLSGVVSLVAFAVIGILIARGASISLEDRHYRPAGALLLALAGLAAAGGHGPRRLAARLTIVLVVSFGAGTALLRHHTLHRLGPPAREGFTLVDCTPAVQDEIRRLGRETLAHRGVLYLSYPPLGMLSVEGRIITTDARSRGLDWIAERPYAGTAPSLVLVLPGFYDADGRGDALRASFRDWSSESWSRRELDGWHFWSASSAQAPATP